MFSDCDWSVDGHQVRCIGVFYRVCVYRVRGGWISCRFVFVLRLYALVISHVVANAMFISHVVANAMIISQVVA